MIQLTKVWKSYGAGHCAFSCDSLNIPDGEIVGVLGENGSGKTTMLKVMMGLTELQEGTVRIDGQPPAQCYERMSLITEEGSFFPNQTPYEYARFLADYFPHFDFERFKRLVSFFELAPHKKIKSFSKGQKSKLEISAGFSKGAKYLFLDEPFLGNDLHTRQDFLKLMVSQLRGEETIIMTTHLIHEIEHVLDRAIVLRYGLIKADFTIDEMREEGKSLEAILAEIARYKPDQYKQVFE